MRKIGLVAGMLLSALLAQDAAFAAPLAKDLFGAKQLPAATAPQSYGFYSKGCFGGGVALPLDGPHWQVMRPSRNRRWGHPAMVQLIEQLSEKAAAEGWPGLLVGDIAQPRGGPMLTGHASHQLGLDVDIWFTPMPSRRLTMAERESLSAHSLLEGKSLYVDEAKWSSAYVAVLRDAARFRAVERIFVHPGVKKKLCDTVQGDRSWLSKIRPYWGHDDHFHIRIGCPPGSTQCEHQNPPPRGDGCDKSLAWWFTDEPWRPAKGPKKPRARDVMTMAALPAQCKAVLQAPPVSSAQAATLGIEAAADAPIYVGIDVGEALSSLSAAEIPLPQPRPGSQ
jgi:penicillin-insensitive murein endopeptidase